jgi:hypothetical protein
MQHIFRICSGYRFRAADHTNGTHEGEASVEDLKKFHILDEAGVTEEQALRRVLDDFAKPRPREKLVA